MRRRKQVVLAGLMIACLMMVSARAAVGTGMAVDAYFGEMPVSGLVFSVWQIGAVDKTGEITATEAFQAWGALIREQGKEPSSRQILAEKMEEMLMQGETVAPNASAATGEDGWVRFSNLQPGLYLVTAKGTRYQEMYYAVSPFCVLLTEEYEGEETVAHAKLIRNPLYSDLTVVKIWEDSCHAEQRPQSITVRLLRDGEVYDTITLPENGRWSHVWRNLETDHRWTVEETPIDGYAVPEITRNGETFTIRNVCNKPTEPEIPELPQTGQLWWPVPVLLCVGLALLIGGLARRKWDG